MTLRGTSALLVLLTLVAGSACSPAREGPEKYGLPRRPTDLMAIEGRNLSRAQQTEVLLWWLEDERAHPTPTGKGLGGALVTSGYRQVQMIGMAAPIAEPIAIDKIASDPKTDPRMREPLVLLLGLMGDRRQVGRLVRILETDKDPYFRALAAEALGGLGATEAVAKLESALKDSYHEHLPSRLYTPNMETIYPVRGSARVALGRLRDPKSLEAAKKRSDGFAKRLDEARKKAASHQQPPDR